MFHKTTRLRGGFYEVWHGSLDMGKGAEDPRLGKPSSVRVTIDGLGSGIVAPTYRPARNGVGGRTETGGE
jgi:hypothetical protein